MVDYDKLGFKCGLEIHQRLATVEKLFCSCGAGIAKDEPIGTIERKQRAVAGEMGAVDPSAKFETLRSRSFVYEVLKNQSCLVDIDEEPPHGLNIEALKAALSIVEALEMKVVDEAEVMRKAVVDGSNPGAFQRTILLGLDGKIKINGRAIGIEMLSLEEESAGILGNKEDAMSYTTDRLGVPLVEIDTDATIKSPSEAKEVALYLGMLLRLSGKVQRGIGTIRQDVNVSIKDGARTEIKGLQELWGMDKFVENEVLRQVKLLEIRGELLKNKASVGEAKDATGIFRGTNAKLIARQLEHDGTVWAFGLKGFKGILGKEINPKRRLGSEISDYAKMAGVNGIIHSDEALADYGISPGEIESLRKLLDMGNNDSFIMVAGPGSKAKKAIEFATERAKHALVGIPLETRGVLNSDDCTTRFLRPLPGGARMYPETDALPVAITGAMIKEAKASAPSIEKKRAELLKQLGDEKLVSLLLISPRLPLYEVVASATSADKSLVANTLLQKFTELKRDGFDTDAISEDSIIAIFVEYAKDRITKQAIEEILKRLAKEKRDVEDAIESGKLTRIRGAKLKEIVNAELAKTKSMEDARRAIMSKYRLNIDGGELNALLSS